MKIALIQQKYYGNREKTLKKTIKSIKKASINNSDLVARVTSK